MATNLVDLRSLIQTNEGYLATIARGAIGASGMDVGDVLQEAYTAAYVSYLRMGELPAAPSHWLAKVVRHVALNMMRDLQARKRGGGARHYSIGGGSSTTGVARHDVAYPHRTPSSEVAIHEAESRLLAAISTLPAEQARAIRLLDFEGVAVNEAASLMERTPEAIRSLRRRGMNSIRRSLTGDVG